MWKWRHNNLSCARARAGLCQTLAYSSHLNQLVLCNELFSGDADGMADVLAALRELMLRHALTQRTVTPIARVTLSRGEATTGPLTALYGPMLCLVVQGGKHVVIGEKVLDYDVGHSFVTSIEVPATGRIIEASVAKPYLAITFVFEPQVIAEVLDQLPPTADSKLQAGFAVGAVSPDLIEAWTRMLRLLDRPGDIPVLAPLVEREILYRLLQGPQASLLRQVARSDSRMAQIRRALTWITMHYEQPLSVENLADLAAMSRPTFHRHFKAATAMSPLQYQKMIRLQQARRMLVIEKREATQVAYAVGYESASQFSREYARQFGAPPARDAERLRSADISFSDLEIDARGVRQASQKSRAGHH